MSPQLRAFLDTISVSELGRELMAASDDGYNVIVGSTAARPILFRSYADHPNVYLPHLDSTAAGRWQQLFKFWPIYKRQLGLRDFGHESQQILAVQLVRECRALEDVEAGRAELALRKCAPRWASLAGAGYGQHENPMEYLLGLFKDCGGTLA